VVSRRRWVIGDFSGAVQAGFGVVLSDRSPDVLGSRKVFRPPSSYPVTSGRCSIRWRWAIRRCDVDYIRNRSPAAGHGSRQP